MNDMTQTIKPKSDQLNADDLIGGPLTIKITKVTVIPDAPQQPVFMHFEGDNGKPYKPCKSMCRVLVHNWGADANKYVGRSLTLYRDESVVFGGVKVGGIRISHMTHIDAAVTMALTATRASRKPFTVKPLAIGAPEKAPVKAATDNPLKAVAQTINDKIKIAPEIVDVDFILEHHADDIEKIKAASAVAYKAILDNADKQRAFIRQPKASADECASCADTGLVDDGFGNNIYCPTCVTSSLKAAE